MKKLVYLSLGMFFCLSSAQAAIYTDLFLRQSDLQYSTSGNLIIRQGEAARVYLQTRNDDIEDFGGWATFRDIPTQTVLQENIPVYVKGNQTDFLWVDLNFLSADEYDIEVLVTTTPWSLGVFPQSIAHLQLVNDIDTDNDGISNIEDSDDDNDGTTDTQDDFPLNAQESSDTDQDGIGNNADTDDDNDGITDIEESSLGTDPLDRDTDEDGVEDSQDSFPTDPNESQDTDQDNIGDNADKSKVRICATSVVPTSAPSKMASAVAVVSMP